MVHGYKTLGVLPVKGVQPTIAPEPEGRPAILDDELKRLDKFTKLHPLHFSGRPSEDPHELLDRCHAILCNLGLVESNGVHFTAFQMQGLAKRLLQVYELGRPAGSPPFTWDQFSRFVLDKFVPCTRREELRRQFEHLQQGQISVTEYEMRFTEQSRHATILVPSEEERVRRFIDGLHYSIHLAMAREKETRISFHQVVEIACRVKRIHSESRDMRQGRDKMSRQSSSFSGASSRG
ncbi:uncharacterized protein [Nicotiana tomentosiformis]|uniref:uncharacterized protein n=1 Tax=Nicotiana tomentosiformis TaxID=4098 RepID=UPI00388CB381